MLLFDVLRLHYPAIAEKECKIHLAVTTETNTIPLDVYLAGDFKVWQARQNQKNFGRKYIVALIQLPEKDKWLFAGGFVSKGCAPADAKTLDGRIYKKGYFYDTAEIAELKPLDGRMVVEFQRSGRASYLNAESKGQAARMTVAELRAERMVIEEFPGYNKAALPAAKLKLVVSQNIESWRGALSSVKGVYLITDAETGKLYVGSATSGEGGIWQRWRDYAKNGHGGNKELKTLLREKGESYSDNFQYAVLEIADTHASDDDILQREAYWKEVLRSREHGYNAN